MAVARASASRRAFVASCSLTSRSPSQLGRYAWTYAWTCPSMMLPPACSLAKENGRREAESMEPAAEQCAFKLHRRGDLAMTKPCRTSSGSGPTAAPAACSAPPRARSSAMARFCVSTMRPERRPNATGSMPAGATCIVHYSIMPTHIEAALPHEMAKRKPADAPSFPALATAPCFASDRQPRARRTA